MSSDTRNLGDEIQSIAARQFLSAVDLLVDRDRLNCASIEPCRIILNGWHTHRPDNWPPVPALDALIVSFHINNEISRHNRTGAEPSRTLLSGEPARYLKRHEPIGARDLWTRDLLLNAGIESYFSGCLTLTLGDGTPIRRGDHVCAVDVPMPVAALLRERLAERLIERTHMAALGAFDERTAQARKLLDLYAYARCVVTTRLHCALPCLALGTPVLLVTTARDPYRFSGLLELVRHCTEAEFVEGRHGFDVEDPPRNHSAYLPFRAELVRTVTAFIEGRAGDRVRSPFTPDAAGLG